MDSSRTELGPGCLRTLLGVRRVRARPRERYWRGRESSLAVPPPYSVALPSRRDLSVG